MVVPSILGRNPSSSSDPTGGPLESWLRASRAIAGGAAFLLALAGAHVRVCIYLALYAQ